MVPLPCVRTPEKLPVTAMTNAIRLVLAPSPRNTGLQILIFEASGQHLSQESGPQTPDNSFLIRNETRRLCSAVFRYHNWQARYLQNTACGCVPSNRTAQSVQNGAIALCPNT